MVWKLPPEARGSEGKSERSQETHGAESNPQPRENNELYVLPEQIAHFPRLIKAFYATSLGQCPGRERLPGGNRVPGAPDALGARSPSSRHSGASPPAGATRLVRAAHPAFAPAGGRIGAVGGGKDRWPGNPTPGTRRGRPERARDPGDAS